MHPIRTAKALQAPPTRFRGLGDSGYLLLFPRKVENTRARAPLVFFLTPSLPYSVIEDKARKQCEHEITERNNSKGVYKQYSDLFITACQAAMETIKNITGMLFPLDLFTDMAYSYANVPLFPIFTTVHYILTACALRKEPGKPVEVPEGNLGSEQILARMY